MIRYTKKYHFGPYLVLETREYEEYDPAYCTDGGSYYQPDIKFKLYRHTALCGLVKEHEVEVVDSSCGGFGERYDVFIDGVIVYAEDFVSHDKKEYVYMDRAKFPYFFKYLLERYNYFCGYAEEIPEDDDYFREYEGA